MYEPQSAEARLAWKTVATDLGNETHFDDCDGLRNRKAACFVSLHSKTGEGESLRGCIGTLAPLKATLYDEIVANARSAAFSDPRFTPLRREELKNLTLSVDVLEAPEPIASADSLDPREYGVIVESGYKRGVLLPNLDGVDTVEKQLDIARMKAGIGLNEEISLSRFRVQRCH